MTDWHKIDLTTALNLLKTDLERGLSEESVHRLRELHGPNELVESGGRSPWRILWEQISGAMVVLLWVAAAVSIYLGEFTDASVIAAIIVLNGALGFFQDYRAERALAALKKLAVPLVRVRRDGELRELSARELVPGDIVLLETGNLVPADGRLLTSANLKIEEAPLTGESEPREKQLAALAEDGDGLVGGRIPLGDRTNMAYMGTVVSYGHGHSVITATGMDTELGHIARSLQSVDTESTPLQKRLGQFGRTLALVAVAIVAIVFLMGIMRGEDPRLMLMTALSMAVAVVPEGLPAVATVALAIGARRMFLRRALIRKLPAVETLGSVTVICSDKTGTLTENRMTVTNLDVIDRHFDLAGMERWAAPASSAINEADDRRASIVSSSAMLLVGASLCNDAELEIDNESHRFHAVGDPTEAALVVAAARLGLDKTQLERQFPRCDEIPFDSDRKRMTTIHQIASSGSGVSDISHILQPIAEIAGDRIAFTKGAVDRLLDVCQYAWLEDEPRPLTTELRARIESSNEHLAGKGMRVLGVAFRPLDETEVSLEASEDRLIYVGMLGMIDPPRAEVADAVERCRSAGIRPIMITGDHPLTAQHIAGQLKIATDGRVLSGPEVEQMNDESLRLAVEETSVYARVSPHDKLRLVQALQQNGQVVAMTGDGVNDAPALKQAHIGVAMGITGTDVSKEASQMVLLDDNFATIVNAVEQGRIVYDNIRKFVKYTMTSNAGEIWVMVIGPLMGMPLPLLPLQILWINLVTDGLPGLALAVEKAERDTMRRAPYPPGESIFGQGMARDIAWIGLLMGVVSLAMGFWVWFGDSNSNWQTIVFTTLTLAQMGNALAIRSGRDSIFTIGIFSNRLLIGSVILTFVLQLLVIYWPPLQGLFKTTALSFAELVACVVISTTVFWAVELHKLFLRTKAAK